MRLKLLSTVTFTLFGFTCGTVRSAVIYESATLGETGITKSQVFSQDVPASNVAHFNFVGVRFEVTKKAAVERIGGHFVGGFDKDSFFGALIRLTDSLDFPDSEDLSTPDVLGWTLMSFPNPSEEIFSSLQVELTPGWYAVLFGSGLFGADGRGGVVRNGNDIGTPEYIIWQSGSGWINLDDLGDDRVRGNRRFVVEGVLMPEPATSLLALITLSIVAVRRRVRS
ncbi:MAG: hypothetical protein WD669_11640 [Pirellulales bacterium]